MQNRTHGLARFAIGTAVALAASGCMHDQVTAQTTPTAVKDVQGVRVALLEKCPLSSAGQKESIAALGAAVLGPLVVKGAEKGIEALAAYFERRAKEQNATFSGRGAKEFYEVGAGGTANAAIGCIVVIRGRFGAPAGQDNNIFTATRLQTMELATPPDFYVEAAVLHASDKSAFRVVPQTVYFARSAAKRSTKCEKSDGNCKTINVALSFEGAMKGKEDPAAFGVAAFSFPDVAEGSYFSPDVLGKLSQTSGWIPAPTAPDKGATGKVTPVSVLATVQESAEDDDFLLAVSAILKEQKTDIAKAIGDAVADAIKPKK